MLFLTPEMILAIWGGGYRREVCSSAVFFDDSLYLSAGESRMEIRVAAGGLCFRLYLKEGFRIWMLGSAGCWRAIREEKQQGRL
jgi:hypothetical protein